LKSTRRELLRFAAGAAVVPLVPRIAAAQAWPTRPVRMMVGFAPGGGADIVARLIAQWLSERLGQAVVIENRPGAATNIAIESVVRAPPDGYTIAAVTTTNAINATLYEKLSFNFLRDIAPVGGISLVPNVMAVNPALPAKTVREFIAYAKANPGKINYGSAGTGAPSHLAGELFRMLAEVDIQHVPYRGAAPALTDLLGGQVQVAFSPMPALIEYIRAGTLRGLAVTSTGRSDALPDLPTVADVLPGYEASTWYGVGAPRDTPAEIVGRLNREINAALADPGMKAKLADLGGMVLPGSGADFGKLIAAEIEKWGKVIRAANVPLQ
jgi:tripartite-type tricarboxylate transporter receptor subunit TctC